MEASEIIRDLALYGFLLYLAIHVSFNIIDLLYEYLSFSLRKYKDRESLIDSIEQEKLRRLLKEERGY